MDTSTKIVGPTFLDDAILKLAPMVAQPKSADIDEWARHVVEQATALSLARERKLAEFSIARDGGLDSAPVELSAASLSNRAGVPSKGRAGDEATAERPGAPAPSTDPARLELLGRASSGEQSRTTGRAAPLLVDVEGAATDLALTEPHHEHIVETLRNHAFPIGLKALSATQADLAAIRRRVQSLEARVDSQGASIEYLTASGAHGVGSRGGAADDVLARLKTETELRCHGDEILALRLNQLLLRIRDDGTIMPVDAGSTPEPGATTSDERRRQIAALWDAWNEGSDGNSGHAMERVRNAAERMFSGPAVTEKSGVLKWTEEQRKHAFGIACEARKVLDADAAQADTPEQHDNNMWALKREEERFCEVIARHSWVFREKP